MSFFDQTFVVAAENAKTPAYFCRYPLVSIDQQAIRDLKDLSRANKGQNVRICMNESPEDPFHDMVILQYPTPYCRPHLHAKKTETIHLIEGQLRIFVFDGRGEILESCLLSQDKTLIYRVQNNYYHSIYPVAPFAIYHESKMGPFLGESESSYPDWAPADARSQEAQDLLKKMAI